MYYNKTLLNSLGLEDPVQLVRDGKWTWDKLRELSLQAAKDLNNDGQFTEADRFGCTSISYDGLVPMFLTSGIKAIIKDEDGRLVYNMMADEASAALQKFKNTFTVNDGMFYGAVWMPDPAAPVSFRSVPVYAQGSWTDDEEPAEGTKPRRCRCQIYRESILSRHRAITTITLLPCRRQPKSKDAYRQSPSAYRREDQGFQYLFHPRCFRQLCGS